MFHNEAGLLDMGHEQGHRKADWYLRELMLPKPWKLRLTLAQAGTPELRMDLQMY